MCCFTLCGGDAHSLLCLCCHYATHLIEANEAALAAQKLEEDEYDDDRIMEKIRAKRLAELRARAAANRFGTVDDAIFSCRHLLLNSSFPAVSIHIVHMTCVLGQGVSNEFHAQNSCARSPRRRQNAGSFSFCSTIVSMIRGSLRRRWLRWPPATCRPNF